MAAAKYTATRMVRRGDLVVVKPGRPAVLGLAAQGAAPRDSRAAEPAFDALLSWLRMGVAAG